MGSDRQKLKVLDLFSGIGGFSLGLERTGGFETVAFCEIDPFCRKVLRKHWPDVQIFEDVRELTGEQVGSIDVVAGGYPCQPFSHAGRRQGADDDRHLWPEAKRIVATVRPDWCLFENVAGHITMGLDEVLSDLEGEGYTCWPVVIPACAVGAPHRRDRVWVMANAKGQRLQRGGISEYGNGGCGENGGADKSAGASAVSECGIVADANNLNAQGKQRGGHDTKIGEVRGKGQAGFRSGATLADPVEQQRDR